MKPIERISMYLQFRNISPHAFEKKIKLSNGYYSKQLRNKGSVGSDILIKIHEHFPDLNMLWVLTGEGNMVDESRAVQSALAEEFTYKFEVENLKLQNLQEDVDQLNTVIKDKEKIISLYEFMLNQQVNIPNQVNPSPNAF
jgi:transcriptional regulator with XRE-family HTH domain